MHECVNLGYYAERSSHVCDGQRPGYHMRTCCNRNPLEDETCVSSRCYVPRHSHKFSSNIPHKTRNQCDNTRFAVRSLH